MAGEKISAEVEGRSLSAMLRVKMRRRMIAKIHTNNDSEKSGDDWHQFINYFDASVL